MFDFLWYMDIVYLCKKYLLMLLKIMDKLNMKSTNYLWLA